MPMMSAKVKRQRKISEHGLQPAAEVLCHALEEKIMLQRRLGYAATALYKQMSVKEIHNNLARLIALMIAKRNAPKR